MVSSTLCPAVHILAIVFIDFFNAETFLVFLASAPLPVPPSAATKNMSSSATPFLSQIQSLLSRHRNAIFGRNFYSALQPDTTFRNSMYLEVLISALLYYVRGYFPNLLNGR